MSLKTKIKKQKQRRQLRVRSLLKNPSGLYRIAVQRSLNYIYAQIIDDKQHKTLLSCSSLELKNLSGDKSAVAKAVGQELAKRALAQGINAVLFDRGRYLYHGRVKSLADGLREGGLQV